MVRTKRLMKSLRSRSEREIDEEVGRHIRTLRLAAGHSLAELGTRLEVSYQQVQKYESGDNRLSAVKLQQIAGIYGVSVQYFFGDIEPRETEFAELLMEVTGPAVTAAGRQKLQLVRFFLSIPDSGVRNAIAQMVRSFAQAEAGCRRAAGVEDPAAGDATPPEQDE